MMDRKRRYTERKEGLIIKRVKEKEKGSGEGEIMKKGKGNYCV